jgi:hypothetical protein
MIFVNTRPFEKRTYVLTKLKLLKHVPDDFEDIMCASTIDKYISRVPKLENICLAEYATSYTSSNAIGKKRNHPRVIQYIWFNEQKYLKNYFREKMMLYVPYRQNDNVLKGDY